jgi:hypothetical protein
VSSPRVKHLEAQPPRLKYIAQQHIPFQLRAYPHRPASSGDKKPAPVAANMAYNYNTPFPIAAGDIIPRSATPTLPSQLEQAGFWPSRQTISFDHSLAGFDLVLFPSQSHPSSIFAESSSEETYANTPDESFVSPACSISDSLVSPYAPSEHGRRGSIPFGADCDLFDATILTIFARHLSQAQD